MNNYLYNGKELQDELGLNWYDYGARMYDPAIGRFTTQDRFSEKYYSLSPYQYAANNPALLIDVNGDSIWIYYTTGRGRNKVEHQVLYDNGTLTINGQAYNAGTNDFVDQTAGALDALRNGGTHGKDLVNSLVAEKAHVEIRKESGTRLPGEK